MTYKTITDFTEIEYACRHCGGKLAVIGEWHGGLSIVGFRDLVYVHAETHSETCTLTYPAQPYDGWAATRLYGEAVKQRWAEEDALNDAVPPPERDGVPVEPKEPPR